ncbi:MAG: hypothetical protein ACOCN0_07930, partial [Prevotella sp.]
MKYFGLSLAFLLCIILSADAQVASFPFLGRPEREVRAVWLTTIGGLDWPHSYSQTDRSAAKQQQELNSL